MGDAAYVMLTRDSRTFTGNFCVDDAILREEGMTDFKQYLADPQAKEEDLIPDFFLDEFEDTVHQGLVERQTKQASQGRNGGAAPSNAAGNSEIQQIFNKIEGYFSEEVVKKTNAVFAFKITDDQSDWFLDLKTGSGSCGSGQGTAKHDVTFTLKSSDFVKMFSGKLKPTTAFMTGKLKISGNMGKAMALEKLMSKMK